MNIHLGLNISHPHWSAHCVDANFCRNEPGCGNVVRYV